MADIVQPDSHTFMTYPFCQKLLVQHGISGAERVTTGNWLACWLAVVTDRMRKYPTERNFNFAQRMTAADFCVQSTTGIEIKSGRRLVVGSRSPNPRSFCQVTNTGLSSLPSKRAGADGSTSQVAESRFTTRYDHGRSKPPGLRPVVPQKVSCQG